MQQAAEEKQAFLAWMLPHTLMLPIPGHNVEANNMTGLQVGYL